MFVLAALLVLLACSGLSLFQGCLALCCENVLSHLRLRPPLLIKNREVIKKANPKKHLGKFALGFSVRLIKLEHYTFKWFLCPDGFAIYDKYVKLPEAHLTAILYQIDLFVGQEIGFCFLSGCHSLSGDFGKDPRNLNLL